MSHLMASIGGLMNAVVFFNYYANMFYSAAGFPPQRLAKKPEFLLGLVG